MEGRREIQAAFIIGIVLMIEFSFDAISHYTSYISVSLISVVRADW